MFIDDFIFWFFLGEFYGLNQGKDCVREFFQYVFEVYSEGFLIIFLDYIISNEIIVVFEF